jgi:hypothetical protein
MATRNIVYSGSGDEEVIMNPLTLAPPSPVPLPEPDSSFSAPVPYEGLAEEVASFVASLALPCDHNWQTVNSAPFEIIARVRTLTHLHCVFRWSVPRDGYGCRRRLHPLDDPDANSTNTATTAASAAPSPTAGSHLRLLSRGNNRAHRLLFSRRPPAPRSHGNPRGNPRGNLRARPLRITNQIHLPLHSLPTRPTRTSLATMVPPRKPVNLRLPPLLRPWRNGAKPKPRKPLAPSSPRRGRSSGGEPQKR